MPNPSELQRTAELPDNTNVVYRPIFNCTFASGRVWEFNTERELRAWLPNYPLRGHIRGIYEITTTKIAL